MEPAENIPSEPGCRAGEAPLNGVPNGEAAAGAGEGAPNWTAAEKLTKFKYQIIPFLGMKIHWSITPSKSDALWNCVSEWEHKLIKFLLSNQWNWHKFFLI